MNWRKIEKHVMQPLEGCYKDWKTKIAEEGFHQCVYCSIHESLLGGIRNFHVEHYRPKSKKRFPHLINDIKNLFYACAICNSFKGDDWPCDDVSDFTVHCYPDPSQTDYSEIFSVDMANGKILAHYPASAYILEKLYLNRPQLIYQRKISIMMDEVNAIIKYINGILDEGEKGNTKIDRDFILQIYRDLANYLIEDHNMMILLRKFPQYSSDDVTKKK